MINLTLQIPGILEPCCLTECFLYLLICWRKSRRKYLLGYKIKLYPEARLQFWRSGECGVLFDCFNPRSTLGKSNCTGYGLNRPVWKLFELGILDTIQLYKFWIFRIVEAMIFSLKNYLWISYSNLFENINSRNSSCTACGTMFVTILYWGLPSGTSTCISEDIFVAATHQTELDTRSTNRRSVIVGT